MKNLLGSVSKVVLILCLNLQVAHGMVSEDNKKQGIKRKVEDDIQITAEDDHESPAKKQKTTTPDSMESPSENAASEEEESSEDSTLSTRPRSWTFHDHFREKPRHLPRVAYEEKSTTTQKLEFFPDFFSGVRPPKTPKLVFHYFGDGLEELVNIAEIFENILINLRKTKTTLDRYFRDDENLFENLSDIPLSDIYNILQFSLVNKAFKGGVDRFLQENYMPLITKIKPVDLERFTKYKQLRLADSDNLSILSTVYYVPTLTNLNKLVLYLNLPVNLDFPPNLTHLHVVMNMDFFRAHNVKALSKLSRLQSLILSIYNLAVDTLKECLTLTNLTALDYGDSTSGCSEPVCETVLHALNTDLVQMSNLKRLIFGIPYDAFKDDALSQLTTLECLELSGYSKITAKSIVCLTNLTALKVNSPHEDMTDLLSHPLTNLTSLEADCWGGLTSAVLRAFPNLHTLYIGDAPSTDLKFLTNLRTLSILRGGDITDADLGDLTHLTSLSIGNAPQLVGRFLFKLTKLKKLIAFNTNIRVSNICKIPNLKVLSFCNSKYPHHNIYKFFTLPNLEALYLGPSTPLQYSNMLKQLITLHASSGKRFDSALIHEIDAMRKATIPSFLYPEYIPSQESNRFVNKFHDLIKKVFKAHFGATKELTLSDDDKPDSAEEESEYDEEESE